MTSIRERALDVVIDRQALQHNLAVVRRLIPANTRILAVVKANAYGHGAVEVARTLSDADGFAVVTTAEAQALRDSGESRPVLVMQGPRDAEDTLCFAALDSWPAIHHPQQADWLAAATTLAGAGRAAPAVWLKVDTGMGRLGVMPEQVQDLLARTDVNWQGVMSHLACADAPGNAHTRSQVDVFEQLVVPQGVTRSIANSAAVISGVGVQWDWVRPGLMLYGCNPLDDRPLPWGIELAPVMTVSAPLIAVKHLSAGVGIGYSQTWVTPEAMPVGYVAAGYADGLPRVLDSSADVLVADQRCPVIGRVSMDSIAIDLRPAFKGGSGARVGVGVGDRVILWGAKQPVERLAAAAGTIAYELLTSVRGTLRYV
jgi:alanine racemase